MPDTYLSFLARRTKGTLWKENGNMKERSYGKRPLKILSPTLQGLGSRVDMHMACMHWATLVKGPGTITGCCRPDPASPDQITSAEHKPRQPGEF